MLVNEPQLCVIGVDHVIKENDCLPRVKLLV